MTARTPILRPRLAWPAIITVTVFLGGPLIIMAYVSLLRPGQGLGVDWEARFNADAYAGFLFEHDFDGKLVFTSDYAWIVWRSITQSAITTVLCLMLGFPTALWMCVQPPKRRTLLLFLVTIPFWTNLLVRNYAWILILRKGGLAENLLNAVGLTGSGSLLYTNFAICIGLTYTFLPFMTLPIYTSLEKLDWRLVEAAFDLGANGPRTLARIIIPLSQPGIIAGCLLVFIPSLGAFVIPQLLGGGKKMMIGNLIGMQFAAARNWPFGAALGFILLAIFVVAALATALATRHQKLRQATHNV